MNVSLSRGVTFLGGKIPNVKLFNSTSGDSKIVTQILTLA